jgi:hypothetical protein
MRRRGEEMSIERAEADLARAKAEVARLTNQLQTAVAKVTKIENYLEIARTYDAPDGDDSAKSRNAGSPIVHATIEILRERGTRQHARALVEELERRGHQIGGTNKITNLSGSLSRSPLLSASRVDGWGLKEWESPGDQANVLGAVGNAIRSIVGVPPPPPPPPVVKTPVPPPPPAAPQAVGPSWEPAGDLDDEVPF